MTSAMNQKEYLKKYLGIGKAPGEKKKKKKKEKAIGNRLKIIDDDVDVLMSQEIEDDLAAANEDAPQIVAVIDERPISLQVDEKTNSSLWTPLGEPSTASDGNVLKVNSFKVKQVKSDGQKSTVRIKKESDVEAYRKHTSASSTVTRIKQESDDWGRNDREKSRSPVRRNKTGTYISTPEQSTGSNTPLRRQDADDVSPPRRRYKDDHSPPRKRDESRDYSPPRRRRSRDSDSHSVRKDEDSSPPRKRTVDTDNSPPRKRNKSEDISPPRRQLKDSSPPRKRHAENSSSPTRKSKSERKRNGSKERDVSPPRKHRKEARKSRWSPEKPPEPEKMKKTLDGKRAGLQNAIDLFVESKRLREKEDEMFANMSADVSGRNAATVIRAKKAKDLEEEAARARREKEMKEKYDLWGKGLKQVEDQNVRIEEQLREMSKPLARYADDEDLEKFLKEQEREGDPMLAYIRKKKKKEKVAAGIPEKPVYMGEFMPNRFGIPPGYRWDGVDRSNGYEKKWFQVQNEKKASREEAFKWLSEDM